MLHDVPHNQDTTFNKPSSKSLPSPNYWTMSMEPVSLNQWAKLLRVITSIKYYRSNVILAPSHQRRQEGSQKGRKGAGHSHKRAAQHYDLGGCTQDSDGMVWCKLTDEETDNWMVFFRIDDD